MEITNNQIYSKIRKKFLKITPEEKVRQSFVDYLLEEHKIDINFLEEEQKISVGTTTVYADLIIKKNKIIDKDIVVEFKKPKINLFEVKNQAISYAKQLDIKNVLICNGLKEKNKIFFVQNTQDKSKWVETTDFIKSYSQKEKLVFKPFDKPALLSTLQELTNYLRTNHGLNDFEAFTEVNKLIFCKIYAEKKYENELNQGALTYSFVSEIEFRNQTGIVALFNQLKDHYRNEGVFDEGEKINLKKEAIEEILTKLNNYNFLTTKEDIKGLIYEHFISQELRGKLGQYFTPRIIIDFILEYLKINNNSKICDPACGTGGFLINYFKSLKEKKLNKKVLKNIIDNNIFGFDFNETLVKVAKMNMILHGDGHVNINKANSLLLDKNEQYDFVVTNPPFGADNVEEKIVDKFTKLQANGIKTKKTEILFLEKIYDILKPGGKAGIVLPLGILNNKSDKKLRKFIIKYFNVELVFRIPKNLFFNAKTAIQTCILILQKKSNPQIKSFKTKMFYVNDFNLTNNTEYINATKNKFEEVIKNKYKEDLLIDISENSYYKLDPGYYLVEKINKKPKNIKIGDILQPYKTPITKEQIKKNEIKTIKSIDSNGKINLHNRINSSKNDFVVEKNTFFYSRLAAYKGSFIYWQNSKIVVTNEYPTFKIKANCDLNPELIELLLQHEYFKYIYYLLATGQGRVRLHVEDFLSIRIPNKILNIILKETKDYLKHIKKSAEIEQNIMQEKEKIYTRITNSHLDTT